MTDENIAKDFTPMPTNDELDDDLLEEAEDMPDDLDEEDLDLEGDDDIAELDTDEDDVDIDVVLGEDEEVPATDEVKVKTPPRDEEDEEDEEEDEDTDDVEASLDVILKERLVVVDDEEEDEDDEEISEGDERGESPLRVLPKQPGEFVCQSCFLVKHPSQLADRDAMLCRDCV